MSVPRFRLSGGYRFLFRPGLSVAVAVSLVILLGLGNWQLERRAWKEALIAQVEARVHSEPLPLQTVLGRHMAGDDQTYQPVFVEGVFDHGSEAHVSGLHDGEPGWFVFTPLEIFVDGRGQPDRIHNSLDHECGLNPLAVARSNPKTDHSSCERALSLEETQQGKNPAQLNDRGRGDIPPEGGRARSLLPRHVYINRGFVPDARKDPATRGKSQSESRNEAGTEPRNETQQTARQTMACHPEGGTGSGKNNLRKQGMRAVNRTDKRLNRSRQQVPCPVTVTGLFRTLSPRPAIAAFFQPPHSPDRNEWYDRAPRLWAERAGIQEVVDFIIDSFATGAEEAPLGGTTRLDFHNRHKEYAYTWFGLAGALMAVYLAFCLRRSDAPG